ncbi:MAG: energy-coupling factor transporter transmembrane protein EcfT [Deltaproteobacteria bacterium]|nr:energy-coupling factor transporter transmembrane protein EcfT [Deltaproteobacteria bacterium]
MMQNTAYSLLPSRPAFLARLDARVKMGALLAASLFSVLLDSPWSLSALCLAAWLAAAGARLGWRQWRLLLFMVGAVTWGTMLSQAIFYYGEPRTVLLNLVEPGTPGLGSLLGEVSLYLEGFRYGAIQSLRISTMLILGLTLCWTTDNAAMLAGLLALRLPFVVSFMTVTALRFLPIILGEFAQVILAFRLRGGRLWSPNPLATLLAWLKIIRPVLINCYRRSATLALSIQTRAFTAQAARRQARNQPLPRAGLGVLGFLASAALAALTLKILYWLYLAGLYYSPALRAYYEFCRFYL